MDAKSSNCNGHPRNSNFFTSSPIAVSSGDLECYDNIIITTPSSSMEKVKDAFYYGNGHAKVTRYHSYGHVARSARCHADSAHELSPCCCCRAVTMASRRHRRLTAVCAALTLRVKVTLRFLAVFFVLLALAESLLTVAVYLGYSRGTYLRRVRWHSNGSLTLEDLRYDDAFENFL
jgi:hypothetical protein